MVNKIVKRLAGWQGKMLSYGGKITLIKSVLHSLPIYTLSALTLTKGTLKLIEKYFSKFQWGSKGDKNNY